MTKYDPLGLDPLVKQEEARRKLLESVERDASALQSIHTDAAQTAMTVEEKKKAKDDEMKREIIAVEREVSPDILKVARTIDQIVNGEVFSTDVQLKCQDEKCGSYYTYIPQNKHYFAKVTVKDGLLEVRIKHQRQDPDVRYNNQNNEEATICINTEREKIKVYYTVRERQGEGTYRISRWTRKSTKAFRFLAEDAVEKNNPFYINDFISMYKTIPEILAKAIAKMSEEQEAKKRQLEREETRLRGEGVDILEELRGSKEEKPKLFEKKEYIKQEFTYKQIRDIGEEIGLYHRRKK